MDPYSLGGFDIFSTMSVIVPILIFGVFAFIILKGISEWNSNNQSPILLVPAEVVTKRSRTSRGVGNSATSTRYYMMFQVESGNRIELQMNGREYGMLDEEDVGIINFQGRRYNGFQRRTNEE